MLLVKIMKNAIKKIISFFTIIIVRIRANLILERSSILLSQIYTKDKSNSVHLIDSNLEFSKITFNGKNHKIRISGNHSRIKINIYGERNSLYISKRASLILSEITIRGKGCKIEIGEDTTFGKNCCLVCMGENNRITIGDQCMFAEQIDVWSSDSHPILNSKKEIINSSKPIIIGNHVWIGKYSKILKGAIIEENSIIGMNTLVTSHIKHNTLNVGIPSKSIKQDINWNKNFINK